MIDVSYEVNGGYCGAHSINFYLDEYDSDGTFICRGVATGHLYPYAQRVFEITDQADRLQARDDWKFTAIVEDQHEKHTCGGPDLCIQHMLVLDEFGLQLEARTQRQAILTNISERFGPHVVTVMEMDDLPPVPGTSCFPLMSSLEELESWGFTFIWKDEWLHLFYRMCQSDKEIDEETTKVLETPGGEIQQPPGIRAESGLLPGWRGMGSSTAKERGVVNP